MNWWMDGWINGWIDGWMDGWMNGRMWWLLLYSIENLASNGTSFKTKPTTFQNVWCRYIWPGIVKRSFLISLQISPQTGALYNPILKTFYRCIGRFRPAAATSWDAQPPIIQCPSIQGMMLLHRTVVQNCTAAEQGGLLRTTGLPPTWSRLLKKPLLELKR